MKKITFLLAICLLTGITHGYSQRYLPFASSNYAGVTGVYLQPASIADSRYKFDLTIAGVEGTFNNNYIGLDPYYLLNPKKFSTDWDAEDFDKEDFLSENTSSDDKSMIINFQAETMSFMASVSNKASIALTFGTRGIINLDNMSHELAKIIYESDNYEDYLKQDLRDANVNIQGNFWTEFGFTYSRVILDEGEHFLKAGATVKLLQGVGSFYGFAKEFSYNFLERDSVSIFHTKVNYGASDNFDNLFADNGFNYENLNYKVAANPSLGFDLGFVYEYRPDWESFKYDLDGETNLWQRDQNKYLFRIGLSILDIGSVKYKRGALSNDFTADIANWNYQDQDFGKGYSGFLNTLKDSLNFEFDNSMSDIYRMNLPTAISLQADVRAAKGLYLNVSPYIALNRGSNDVNKVHYLTAWNVVPRYEGRFFGLYLPFQYNSYKQLNVGAGLRFGPLWIGSNNLFSIIAGKKDIYGINASVALKFGIRYKKAHDRDKDKVSDRKDNCPDVPGLAELAGCPDADLDGVTDAEDLCPNEPGLKEFSGCPDRDGDSIIDSKDDCPDVKGLPQFNGCPDSDGDGIIDSRDDCPFNAGLAELNGCPDQDSDGIADKEDNCPTVFGTRENHGCPFIDSDDDGVKDEDDQCPGIKGPVENHGCPYTDTDNDGIPDKDDECPSIPGTAIFRGCPDTDGDGISDKYDMCPTIPGVAQNNGCPEIKKEEQEIINTAFANLEFETGKSVIRRVSYPSLNELAQLLVKHPEWKLQLSGHTDNVGKRETNMTLSKNRTLAVKKFLQDRSVPASCIRAEWFGPDRPVDTNATPEGRQHNRRVEMKIVFE
ncbi:MAG TPA: DUF5723 family protein [Bacteroidales bacterium]|nr:DUF5723 family protein [Bacteroidales bacterium]